MSTGNRTYEIVIWGATGFTGRLVVEYLIQQYPEVSIAIAGRNQQKCQALLKEFGVDLPIVIADAFDEVSLREMVRQTQVVCTTVGPYSTYGELLVEVCVEEGTHYCDLTGESPFVRSMIDRHHSVAMTNRVSIVHACGFDSIPSDLGVLMIQEYIRAQTDQYAGQIQFVTGKMKGGFSGGTIASFVHMLDRIPDNPDIPKILNNPYALNPDSTFKGPDGRDQMHIRYSSEFRCWTAPFVMAGTNTRIVRRSHALQEFPYGKDFQYSEVMGFPKGLRGLSMAFGLTLGLGGLLGSMVASTWLRRQIWKRLPQPGEGPTAAERQAGYFKVHLYGQVDGKWYEGIVGDSIDPGYACTAKMLAESCLCLVQNRDELPMGGGVLTPATAFGSVLLERLKRAGMRFECRPWNA